MKYLLEVCLIALTLATSITPSAAAQSAVATPASALFAGTWEGKMNDLPAIHLKIDEADGEISGVIVFYYQERSDPNSPWHVEAEHPARLLAPHVEGKTLTFEVEHHKCHGCAELGPNARFRMEVTGPNEAQLWNLVEQTGPGPGLKLIRQPEATTHAAQPLQKGIGVELPVTSTAVPVPGADKEDAVIVTITQDGSVYFGVNLIRPAALPETIKRGLSNQTENKVYIKADARTPYANLVKVLDAVHTADVKALTLLTAQHDSPEPGTPVPPKGLELLIAPR